MELGFSITTKTATMLKLQRLTKIYEKKNISEREVGDTSFTPSKTEVGDVINVDGAKLEILGIKGKTYVAVMKNEPKYFFYINEGNIDNKYSWKVIFDDMEKYDDFIQDKVGEKFPLLEVGKSEKIDSKNYEIIYGNNKEREYFATIKSEPEKLFQISINNSLYSFIDKKVYKVEEARSHSINDIPKLKEWYDKLKGIEDGSSKKEEEALKKKIAKFDFSKYLTEDKLFIAYYGTSSHNGWAIVGANDSAEARKIAGQNVESRITSVQKFSKYVKEMGEGDIKEEMFNLGSNLPKKNGDFYEIEWGS